MGPFNYKGLVTPWEEPLDIYYLYKANYVPAAKEPMVYLVSHTWPDRFINGRRRATIEAYVLRAVGYYKGKPVTEDVLLLNGLEQAPSFENLYHEVTPVMQDVQGEKDYTYIYRINCGGDAYVDSYGQRWAQDNSTFSHSWAESLSCQPKDDT